MADEFVLRLTLIEKGAQIEMQRNVVIFTGKYTSASIIEAVEAVAMAFPQWRITVFQEFPRIEWRKYVKSKYRLLKEQPLSYPVEMSVAIHRRAMGAVKRCLRSPVNSSASAKRLPESLEALKLPNVVYRRCQSLRDTDVIRDVRDLSPWLGVAIGAPILDAALFRIPQLGTVNLHKSLLPEYRGMPPGFWELYHSEQKSGASVHWVEQGLDTGDVICQRELSIPKYATPFGLAMQLDVLGTEVLLDALRRLESGRFTATRQGETKNRANRQPPWLLSWRLSRRLANRRKLPQSLFMRLRLIAKHIIVMFYLFLWAPIRNRILSLRGKCHAVVILYHRVDDKFLDSVTVGVEQFDRQLSLIGRHYDVLDIKTFLAKRNTSRTRPCVVITFDDGYEDNYLAAALLRRHGLPATFFVSTGMIGTEQPFPHDMLSLGYRVPSLSWTQVEQMSDWGFAIGIHTVNHARLSALPRDDALAEVALAKRDLEGRLGPSEASRCLAYPYGQKADISDEIREHLNTVGVEWCCSAYGGINSPGWDQLNILRCGIDFSMSDLVFRAILEGWTRPLK